MGRVVRGLIDMGGLSYGSPTRACIIIVHSVSGRSVEFALENAL